MADNKMLHAFKNKELRSRIKEILLYMLQQESVDTSKSSKITKLRGQVFWAGSIYNFYYYNVRINHR